MTAGFKAGDLLLYWLAHTREGSWASFARALAALQAPENGAAASPARMRSWLAELTHAEFFVDGTNRWRILAPVLGALGQHGAALVGGRTPRLVEQLAGSAERAGCEVEILDLGPWPNRVRVVGTREAAADAARQIGVPYTDQFAEDLAAAVVPVPAALSRATPAAPPINWTVRSFDFGVPGWVEGLLPDTAYEYRSRHGHKAHYVRAGRRRLLQLDRRRNAVYAAAMLNRVSLLTYDEESHTLGSPRTAPMPEEIARAAAACTDAPPLELNGGLAYRGIPPSLAGLLMAAAGQRPPDPHWLTDGGNRG